MAPLVRFFGMKRGWLVLGSLQSAAFLGYYYIGNISQALALTAFYGLAGARDAFSFTYIAQLVPEAYIALVSMLYVGCNSLTLLVESVYFWQISQNY